MGFMLRNSEAGLTQDKQAVKMHFGAIERVISDRNLPGLNPVIRALKSGVLDEMKQ